MYLQTVTIRADDSANETWSEAIFGAFRSDFWGTISDLATIVAIIAGAIWTYKLFIQRRQKAPRADVSHTVSIVHVEGDRMWVHLAVQIKNIGDVLVSLCSADTRIQQVFPIDEGIAETVQDHDALDEKASREIEWPLIGHRKSTWSAGKFEIEPGETDHLHYDFLVDNRVSVVQVYTHLLNQTKRKRQVGWCETTVYFVAAGGRVNKPQEILMSNREMSLAAERPSRGGSDSTKQQAPKPLPKQPLQEQQQPKPQPAPAKKRES